MWTATSIFRRRPVQWLALLLLACGGNSVGPDDPGEQDPPPGPGPIATITVTGIPDGRELRVGSSMSLAAVGRDADGTTVPSASVSWSVSPSGRVTLGATSGGNTTLTATGVGEVTITASTGSVAATEVIEVLPQGPMYVTPIPARVAIYRSMSIQLRLDVTDNNGQPVADPPANWTSSNLLAATVDETGFVTAVGLGTANITAEIDGTVGTTSVTIVERPISQWGPNVGDWATHQGNPAQTGYVPARLDPAVFKERWTAQGIGGEAGLATGDGKVFVADWNSGNDRAVALDAVTGTIVWQQPIVWQQMPGRSDGPAFADGSVYFVSRYGGDSGALQSYDAGTGLLRFAVPFEDGLRSYVAPIVVGDKVAFGGAPGIIRGIYAFSTIDGTEVWSDQIATTDSRVWSPASRNGLVYVYPGATDNDLLAYDLETGELLYSIPNPGDFGVDQRSMRVSPVLGEQHLFVVHGRRLVSFDLQNRTIKWTQTGDFYGQPVVANGVVYVGNGTKVDARHENDGSLLWAWERPFGPPHVEQMLVTDNILFVSMTISAAWGGGRSATYAVDLDAREHTWEYPVGGRLAMTSDGVLLIARTRSQPATIAIDVLP